MMIILILIASKTMLINRKILTMHSFCANRTSSYHKLCKVNASFLTVLWQVWQ